MNHKTITVNNDLKDEDMVLHNVRRVEFHINDQAKIEVGWDNEGHLAIFGYGDTINFGNGLIVRPQSGNYIKVALVKADWSEESAAAESE